MVVFPLGEATTAKAQNFQKHRTVCPAVLFCLFTHIHRTKLYLFFIKNSYFLYFSLLRLRDAFL